MRAERWFDSSIQYHFNVARSVTVSITDCDSVGEGSTPFEQPQKYLTFNSISPIIIDYETYYSINPSSCRFDGLCF